MLRRSKGDAGKRVYHRAPSSPSRFSPAFIEEVRACEDVETFVELMENRGIWLNRNAADGVFAYICSLGGESLSDEDLSDVTGGVPWGPGMLDPTVQSAISSLADQLQSGRH